MDQDLSRPRTRSRSLDVPRHLNPHDEYDVLPSYRATEVQREQSPLDISQRLERQLAKYNASQNIFKRWLFEIVSWIVSAICMGAIIGILASLNGKALDTWPPGITITTILSKVASAALILPTSEAIGQLKWSWFNGNSKEIFSRRGLGLCYAPISYKRPISAALGAILTLLLLATDAFFQQVAETSERWILWGSSSIPKATRYDPNFGLLLRSGEEIVQNDQKLVSVTDPFFYGNGTQPKAFGNGTQPDISLSCPTSNCTWPIYETFGVCSACTELPPNILSFACLSTRVDWVSYLTGEGTEMTYPNGTMCGYFINATSDDPVFVSGYLADSVNSSTGRASQGEALLMRTIPLTTNVEKQPLFGGSINFKYIRNPILNFLHFSANSIDSVYRNDTPIAQECVLHFCVKTIESLYFAATYEETIVNTAFNDTPGNHPWNATTIDSTRLNGTNYNYSETASLTMYEYTENVTIHTPTTSPTSLGYGCSNITMANTATIFDDIFPSMITRANPSAQALMRIKFFVNKSNNLRPIKGFNPWLAPNNVTRHMERLATAMTNVIRSTEGNESVLGHAFTLEVFIWVRWAWLTFPLALLLLTLVFLVSTILKTSRGKGEGEVGVWKTSAMPTLIYGLPTHMQKQLASSAWTNSQNKKLRIKLFPNQGWRMSGQVDSPHTPTTR